MKRGVKLKQSGNVPHIETNTKEGCQLMRISDRKPSLSIKRTLE